MCPFIVGAGDSPKSLLAGSIPNLKLNDIPVDSDGPA